MFKRFPKLRLLAARRVRRGSRRSSDVSSFLKGAWRRPALLLACGMGVGMVIGIVLAGRSGSPPNPAADPPRSVAAIAKPAPPPAPSVAPPPSAPALPALPAPAGPPPAAAGLAKPAWKQYALAVPETDGRPMVAIVIDDMGIDKAESARVIGLPGPLTIAFMAYATELERQARAARAAGHEIWLHVPMEPLDGELDSGPNTLKTELSPAENRRRLEWDLSRLQGFVGINNHMGSRFSGWEPGMRLVLEELKGRALAFLDSRTTAATVGGRIAAELGVPHIDRDVFIDNDETVAAVLAQLDRAERIAEKRGYALAIGHPHATTIAALAHWLPGLKAKGLVLVPASALLRRTQTATSG